MFANVASRWNSRLQHTWVSARLPVFSIPHIPLSMRSVLQVPGPWSRAPEPEPAVGALSRVLPAGGGPGRPLCPRLPAGHNLHRHYSRQGIHTRLFNGISPLLFSSLTCNMTYLYWARASLSSIVSPFLLIRTSFMIDIS